MLNKIQRWNIVIKAEKLENMVDFHKIPGIAT